RGLHRGENRLVGGDHRMLLDRRANGADLALHCVRGRCLPGLDELAHRRYVHVRGGRNAARASLPQRIEQISLAAWKDLEAWKSLKKRLRILPVARTVLESRDHP